MANETPVNIITRQTAVNTTTTNKNASNVTINSSNKGAALTNAEMDMNFLNTKKSIDTLSAQYYIAHNEDGTIKPAYIAGTTHYVEDTSTNANQLAVAIGGLTSLTAGLQLLVKVKTLNTGSSTITVSNSATSPPTVLGGGAKGIFKSKDVALVAGELKADEIVNLVFDGTQFQVLNEGEEILDNQTVGSLITFDSAGKAVVVAPGTTGQVLTATDSQPPAFATSDNNIKEYDLGSVPPRSWKRMLHNLTEPPKHMTMYLECINNASSSVHKWNVGDRIYYLSGDVGGGSATQGPAIWADSLFVGVQINTDSGNSEPHWELPIKYGQGATIPTDNSVVSGTFNVTTGSGTSPASDGMWDYNVYDTHFKIVLQASI